MDYGWLICLLSLVTVGYASQYGVPYGNCSCLYEPIYDTYKIRCHMNGIYSVAGHLWSDDRIMIHCFNTGPDLKVARSFESLPECGFSVKGVRFIVIDGCSFSETTLHHLLDDSGYRTSDRSIFPKKPPLPSVKDSLHMYYESTSFTLVSNFTDAPGDIFEDFRELKLLRWFFFDNVRLPIGIFEGLSKMEHLAITGGWQSRFMGFQDSSLKEHLVITEKNQTLLSAGIFKPLHSLEILNLSFTNFSSLPENFLSYNPNLREIRLTENQQNLTALPSSLLKLSKLKLVVLSKNGLQFLPEDIFWGAPSLEDLDLSVNYLTSLPELIFKNLGKLRALDLSHNGFSDIPDGLFAALSELRRLDLSHNHLSTTSEMISSLFRHCIQLQELRLNHNNITKLFEDLLWGFQHVSYLDLSYNKISTIHVGHELLASHIDVVNLTYNNINHIVYDENDGLISRIWLTRERILIDGNPIQCDCAIGAFVKYVLRSRLYGRVSSRFIEPDSLQCKSPVWLQDQLVAGLNSSSLHCMVDDAQCDDCCPDECSCWTGQADHTFIVECSYRNLSQAPRRIVGLDGYHTVVLNLTGNSLTEIPRIDRDGYENVTRLLLSHNNISTVDPSVLQLLRESTSLTELTLHENPWKCDCDSFDFVTYIQTEPKEISQIQNMKCAVTDTTLLHMHKSEICPMNIGLVVGGTVALALLGISVGILVALYYKYQREVKVWLYAHRMFLSYVTEEELDKDKLFDAFISYSHKDEDFVLDELVTNLLEGPTTFRLCLHFRDWVAGDWISKQITRSVENSRRTIVVLSPNFVESVWGRLEFRAAHRQALNDGRPRVIVVMLGDIGPTDNLDPELKVYLTTNTYVRWGDPYFWDQLIYALPHAPIPRKQGGIEPSRIPHRSKSHPAPDHGDMI